MMATETSNPGKEVGKRAREESSEGANDGGGSDDTSKKQKGEKGVGAGGEKEAVVQWSSFGGSMTSRKLFVHFTMVIRHGLLNFPFSDERLLDLVKKGQPDAIGCGVESFQIRGNEMCSNERTFFLVRKDGSTADFCFRTCINNILPLPEGVKLHPGGIVAVCLCHVGGRAAVLAALASRNAAQGGGGGRGRRTIRRNEDIVVTLGPTKFRASWELTQYFSLLLFNWPLNEAITGDSHLRLMDLLKKGDPEWEKKIDSGFESFQVRIHPAYDGDLRSFYLVRRDGSVDDFCYLKLVENIIPLTEELRETGSGPCSCHHKEDGRDGGVTLGYHRFRTSTEMAQYFNRFLQYCELDTPIGSEVLRVMLLNLLKKGDPEWGEKKKTKKLQSFQVRRDPNMSDQRSLFIVWEDGSMEPFCAMRCIDNILPLPVEYKCLSTHSCRGGGVRRGRSGGCNSGAGKRNKKRRL